MKIFKPMLLLLFFGSIQNPLQSQAPANHVLMMVKFANNVTVQEENASKRAYHVTQLDSTVLTKVRLWAIPDSILNRYSNGLSGVMSSIETSYNAQGTIRASTDSFATIRLNTITPGVQSCFNPQFSAGCVSNPYYKTRVAIIDSGLDTAIAARNPTLNPFFNKNLSRNFSTIGETTDSLDIRDRVGGHHGAVIADIIGQVWLKNGMRGMNQGQEILMLRVFDSTGKATPWGLVKSLDYSLQKKVDLVNISLNWRVPKQNQESKTTVLQQIFWQLADSNIIVIASAGNNNPNGQDIDRNFPIDSMLWLPGKLWYGKPVSSRNPLLTVAATTCRDELAKFSNFGTTSVKVAALGENIPARGNSDTLKYYSGTSMSSAIVAGLVGLRIARIMPANRGQTAFLNWTLDDCGKLVGGYVILLSKEDDIIKEKLHLKVYPNPVKDDIQIEFELDAKNIITLQLQDLFGRVLQTKTIDGFSGANQVRWQLPSLASGLYLLNLKINQTVISRKISLF